SPAGEISTSPSNPATRISLVLSLAATDWPRAEPARRRSEPKTTATRTRRPAVSREFIVSVVLPLSKPFITERRAVKQANVSRFTRQGRYHVAGAFFMRYGVACHFLHFESQNLVKDLLAARVPPTEFPTILEKVKL